MKGRKRIWSPIWKEKIERLATEEEDRKILKDQLWEQFKTNGYGVRETGKRIDKNEKKKRNRRENKEKNMVRYNKYRTIYRRNKGHIKKAGLNIFRKGGEKLETMVKKNNTK